MRANPFGLDELCWDAAGQLIDGDGRLVNGVWKTWAWETAIEQVREVATTSMPPCPFAPVIRIMKCVLLTCCCARK
ncbi:hypothetical protein ACLK1Y_16575 [Escherichia coli]